MVQDHASANEANARDHTLDDARDIRLPIIHDGHYRKCCADCDQA